MKKRQILGREAVSVETDEGYVVIRQDAGRDPDAEEQHVVRIEPEDVERVKEWLDEAAEEAKKFTAQAAESPVAK